jgi:hypothetical protein
LEAYYESVEEHIRNLTNITEKERVELLKETENYYEKEIGTEGAYRRLSRRVFGIVVDAYRGTPGEIDARDTAERHQLDTCIR